MKETGLMFKAPLVRSILAGQKTQTRRVVKWKDLQQGLNLGFSGLAVEKTKLGWVLRSDTRTSGEWRCSATQCPVGQPGDRIYVRETFARVPTVCGGDELVFAADYQDGSDKAAGVKYTPAIHMPKDLARIWLEVTGVRVERLQSISEADCGLEGVEAVMHEFDDASQCEMAKRLGCCIDDAKPLFAQLWESTGGDWAENPWVWVVDFKTISTTGRPA